MRQRLVLLCGRTVRSSIYVQALAHAGLIPEGILVYGDAGRTIQSDRALLNVQIDGLFTPDPTLELLACLQQLGWRYQHCGSRELDDEGLQSALDQLQPDLVVYSGYGGQLVPATLLNRYDVLHVHSGWLPEFRGSTTLYYQVLEQRECAATALLLDEQIDTGPMLARKRYPLPPPGIDVDYLYDNMIRADLLVEVLRQWRSGSPWLPLSQDCEGLPYFIIHPLLKHLALLSIDGKELPA